MSPSHTFESTFHAPVLVNEVLELLGHAHNLLDCTLGGGGHALALLERGARVTGIDQDHNAILEATRRIDASRASGRFHAIQASFGDIAEIRELAEDRFDGILLDLGVSSHQLDDERRGFTFRRGAPLDMRMNALGSRDAATLLNELTEAELTRLFRDYADLGARSARLGREVARRRVRAPFRTSDDLVDAIRAVLGPRSGPAEFAPIFQGVRIAVNDELHTLEGALPALRDRLTAKGVMVVISYHSGEDRAVKQAFRSWSAACVCPPRQPVCTCRGKPLGETITRRAIVAQDDEVARNARARSARLRAWRAA